MRDDHTYLKRLRNRAPGLFKQPGKYSVAGQSETLVVMPRGIGSRDGGITEWLEAGWNPDTLAFEPWGGVESGSDPDHGDNGDGIDAKDLAFLFKAPAEDDDGNETTVNLLFNSNKAYVVKPGSGVATSDSGGWYNCRMVEMTPNSIAGTNGPAPVNETPGGDASDAYKGYLLNLAEHPWNKTTGSQSRRALPPRYCQIHRASG